MAAVDFWLFPRVRMRKFIFQLSYGSLKKRPVCSQLARRLRTALLQKRKKSNPGLVSKRPFPHSVSERTLLNLSFKQKIGHYLSLSYRIRKFGCSFAGLRPIGPPRDGNGLPLVS